MSGFFRNAPNVIASHKMTAAMALFATIASRVVVLYLLLLSPSNALLGTMKKVYHVKAGKQYSEHDAVYVVVNKVGQVMKRHCYTSNGCKLPLLLSDEELHHKYLLFYLTLIQCYLKSFPYNFDC